MNLRNFKKLFSIIRQLYGEFKLQIFGLLGISIFNGFIGSLGISTLIPLFSYVVRGKIDGTDPVSKGFNAVFQYFNLAPNLRTLLIIVASLFVFKAVILSIFSYYRETIRVSFELRSRSAFYSKVLAARWNYLSKQKLGYLNDVLMNDLGTASVFLKEMAGFSLYASSFLIYTVTAFSISPFVALLTLGFGMFSIFLLKPFMGNLFIISRDNNLLQKEIAHQINENVLGAKTIKIMNAEGLLSESIGRLFEKSRDLAFRFRKVRILLEEPVEPLSMIFITVIFAISFLRPGFQLPAFLVTVYLIKNILEYIDKMRNFAVKTNGTIPILQRILELRRDLGKYPEEDSGRLEFQFKNELEFKNVGFAYEPETAVLKNISFKVRKGEMIGIIGSSGAGKTTIADLLTRLLVPTAGNITADGIDINNIKLRSWRENIGYVAQDIFLKNDTIENNIRFYDENITDETVTEAAGMAQCSDFIAELPQGLKSSAGEHGNMLSGGQRQRIALARALARKPELLILDEATSSIDNQSEAMIKKAIEDLKGKVTVIIIAHRLSTILNADRLIALAGGEVKEQGSPDILLKNKASYLSIANDAG